MVFGHCQLVLSLLSSGLGGAPRRIAGPPSVLGPSPPDSPHRPSKGTGLGKVTASETMRGGAHAGLTARIVHRA